MFKQLVCMFLVILAGVSNTSSQQSLVISVDRSIKFDPEKFGLNNLGIEETDAQSTVLTKLDLSKVRLETMLKDEENYISATERFKRLKDSEYILLDADIFRSIYVDNHHLIPEEWKKKVNGNTNFICFYGTVMQADTGRRTPSRYVVCLYWDRGSNVWHWIEDSLDRTVDRRTSVAVLPKQHF